MKEEYVFRQTRETRRIRLLNTIILFVAMIIILISIPLLAGGTVQDIVDLIAEPFGWIVVAIFLLFGVVLGYWVLFAWKDRLVISETHIERRGLHHIRIYRGPVRYEDVVRVRRGVYGTIVIERSQGRKFEIVPKVFEGGSEAILGELRKRIPAERFEVDLERSLYERTLWERRAGIFFIVGGLIYLLGLFSDDLFDKVRQDFAWKTEIRAKMLAESIEDFALEADGSIWLLVQNRPGDYEDPQSYEVRHITASETETLRFPSIDVLFPEGPPEFGSSHPSGITVTEEGVPRVIFFLIETALIWTDNQWAWERPQPSELQLGRSYLDILLQSDDSQYWEKLAATHKVQVTIPSSGVVEEVDLGPELDRYAVVFEGEPRGWTMVHLRSPERRLFLLAYRDDPSESSYFELEVEDLPLGEFWNLTDSTVGPDGSIYTLIRPFEYCINDIVTFFSGKLDPVTTEGWIWRVLQYPQDCDDVHDPREFVVDVRGRVWIQGWRQVVGYGPSVFDKPQSDPMDLILYTEDNSGFYMSHRLEVGPDERIWSLDMSGDALVWIDADVDNLQKPLPPWVAKLSESYWTTFVLMGVGAGIWILGSILARNEGRLRRRRQ